MIWVTGSRGMLGSELLESLREGEFPCTGTDREVDLTSAADIDAFLQGREVTTIINCAAYTDVERAEDEPAAAEAVNGTAVKHLAEAALRTGARLIHFSTDFVFDGSKREPYTEEDPVNPISVYGKTKLSGEEYIRAILERYYIFRISWLYGKNGKNFVDTMLHLFRNREELYVIDDQTGSPTSVTQVTAFLLHLLAQATDRFGLYHLSGEGPVTWYGFAGEIQRQAMALGLTERDIRIRAVSSGEYPAKAVRPVYSYMSKSKLKEKTGYTVEEWPQALGSFLASKKS